MLDRIPLGYYALAGLVNFLSSLVLSFFVIYKNPKSSVNRVFSFFALGASCWGLFHFLWLITTDNARLADFYLRTVMIFVILVPAAFTHFILTFLKIGSARKINLANYGLSLFFALTAYTDLFAREMGSFLVFPYWLKPGPVFHFHMAHFLANIVYSHYLMLGAIKGSAGTRRQQIFYVFIGTAIGYTAGVLNYLPWYRIPIPPFLNPLVSIYVATVAYAIIRHHLMDIEVVIKRTLIFAGLFAFMYATFMLVAFLGKQLLEDTIGWDERLALIPAIVIIIFVHGPLRAFLVNATDKYLFQKKYNPLQMIHDFSQTVLTELNLNKIMKQTVNILLDALRAQSCGILLPNKEGNKFVLKESSGIENKEICVEEKSPFVSRLSSNHIVSSAFSEMKELGAVLCIGILIRKNLIGILALGQKKSDEDYTPEDIEVLNILADALGVAITNAMAYEELRHKANLVTLGTLASGIKHDISKPIDRMNADVSGFLIRLKQRGSEDPSKMLNEGGNLLERCCDTFQQVISISEKYAARPKENEKPISLRISDEIDSAMSVIQQRINKNGIKIIKEIPPNLPNVYFDKDYMRQIFDNILTNAIDAIEAAGRSKGESSLTIKAREVENRTLNVRLEITDTGTGIPEKIRDKIFKSWFSTKGEKGTGLGLALVSELVMRGGGTVEVESQEGKGSTFILGFKGIR